MNMIKKFVFVFLLTFTFSLSTVTAQNDTVYVMKNGNVIGKYNVKTEIDSVIFYQQIIQPDNTMYVMKNGNVKGKYNLDTEVDSLIFYKLPGTTPVAGTIGVQITVPAGSNYSHTGSKVMSYSTWSDVDAIGKSKAAHIKGAVSIAYLFDKNDKLIMAGFITDSSQVISPATTAKVLLYLGYNIPLQPDTLSVYFLNNIDKLSGAKEWEKEFETLFLADPLTLSNKSFVAPLKQRMAQMIDQSPPIDIRLKAADIQKVADIQVDANDIKSGLQISDDGLSNFKIINNYRRRAYFFLYKMSYKDMTGLAHEIKNEIETGTKADMDKKVDPISAVSGFFSEIGKNIEGKGLESFSVTSGPFPLVLGDNESEAIYKLRVVGPGNMGKPGLTEAEKTKLTRLEMETFLYDLIIPAVAIIVSAPNKPVNGVAPSVNRDLKADALLTLLKSMPDVLTEVSNGNYKGALKKLLLNVYNDGTGVIMKELFMIALDNESVTGVTGGVSTFINERFENLLFILSMTDAALGASDLIRITAHALSSSVMEEWDIKARSGQVKLSPKESSVVTLTQQKISAEVKNLDESGDVHPFFVWSTSGKYGTISDTKGHNGKSFESADKDIFYRSNAKSTDLSDGDNIEYIYVKAFLGSKLIGTDTVKVNVKKNKYVMKPEGITLTGKEGGANEVALYLEIPKGGIPIQPNNDTDFKVIWTTAGKYGKLNAKDITGVKTITLYDNNSVYYECLDKDTKEGTETIYARIYSKSKKESKYSLFDEIKGTVKINNDPKKKIFIVPVTYTAKILTPSVGNWAVFPTVQFAVDKDAKSYQVRLFNFTGTWANPPEGRVYAWDAGKYPNTPYNFNNTFDIEGGQYYMVFGRTWCGGACDGSATTTWIANYKKGYGSSAMAEVTITLK